MRKIHWISIGLILVIGLLAGLAGWLYSYATRPDIPEGIQFYNWDVGGLTPEQFVEEWEKKLRGLKEKKVTFILPDSKDDQVERSLTMEEAVEFHEEKLMEQVLAFQHQPSIWEKAWYRWEARKGIQLTLGANWKEDEAARLFRERWSEWFEQQPQNAIRIITDQDEVKIEEDQSAFQVDLEALKTELGQITPHQIWTEASFSIPLSLTEIQADIRMEHLLEEGIERKISEFSTSYSTETEGRTHNVEVTSSVLHDTLLQPDEIFSYRKLIQETEKKFGYKPAPVILEGELRPGIGGGVCQVSTTLYNTVLLSDLRIIERRNHSLPIGYAPLGRDATYSDWGIDFRFQNSTGKHLLIRTEATNGQLTVKLFGTSPKEKQVEILTETVKVLTPQTETRKDPTLAAGQTKVLREGKQGYQVHVYKLIKHNGEPDKKVLVSKDTYKAQPKIVLVGE